jgi:DNA-binding NtrC family response regulator
VVLLDLKMPGMGGDEIFPRLKAIDPNAHIIVASGYSEQETLNYFANNNEVAFIQKPYRFQALVEMVASVLGQTL